MPRTHKALPMGPKAKLIESKFDEMTGKFSLALTSGTAAQLCGLRAWMAVHRIQPGAEVIVSGLELSPMALNCLQVGLVPVFADIDADTLQPTLKTLQAAKTDKTVAVHVTHYAGYPCTIDDIWDWCKVRRYFLMDDATRCLPTIYKKWSNGSWPTDMTTFFLHGGATLCVREEAIYKEIDNHRKDGPWQEANPSMRGYHAELTEPDADCILRELSQVQDKYQRRSRIWGMYNKALEMVDEATLPWDDSKWLKQSCQEYILRLDNGRDALVKDSVLGSWTIPRPYCPLYKRSIWTLPEPHLPEVERFMETALSLPMDETLVKGTVDAIVKALA